MLRVVKWMPGSVCVVGSLDSWLVVLLAVLIGCGVLIVFGFLNCNSVARFFCLLRIFVFNLC